MQATEPEWFKREMEVLAEIQVIVQELPHLHLISPIASYKFTGKAVGYILFPWADRGNLKDFWDMDDNKNEVLHLGDPRALMEWTLREIRGLCEAVSELHKERPRKGEMAHCRHGDLKPENILVFQENGTDVLRIADVGLGKFHTKSTDVRMRGNQYTKTVTGTLRYLAPEFKGNGREHISRKFDVWSLGCLFLEFIIWAGWGVQGLDKFMDTDIQEFWQKRDDPQHVVHSQVERWIHDMGSVLERGTALGDLLRVVSSSMLKGPGERSKSKDVLDQLDVIIKKSEDEPSYCLSSSLQSRVRGHKLPAGGPGMQSNMQEELVKLEDVWQSHADNDFARDLWKLLNNTSEAPDDHVTLPMSKPVLCARCFGLDLLQPDLEIEDRMSELAEKSKSCQLCEIIHTSLENIELPSNGMVLLQRDGPTLKLQPSNRAILSLYSDPGSQPQDNPLFQVGTPRLADPGSKEQCALFNEWLRVCDETHQHATNNIGSSANRNHLDDRPTRVVDVGDLSNPSLRLAKGKDMESPVYFAPSHRWGDNPSNHFGRTVVENYTSRFTSIEWNELPLNFQDAITVTRNLGVRYLWIDSICITQDEDNDWIRESLRMEQVYSNAKCVLAASSAESSIEGFLKRPTPFRPFIALPSRSGDVSYICRSIDNFKGDVDEAILNTRGWTLQERALARRTIHFTKNQVYFECGKGVRCESLTRLTNGRASLLGDSDFPTSVEPHYKDGKVVLVQTLYEQYSKRKFYHPQDRPISISGLEKRLTSAFNTRGGYGIFQTFLERSLLWKRSDNTPSLKLINYTTDRNVPTWSWMAYDGVISYVQADFDKVNWQKDFSSPFDSGSGAQGKWHWEADGTNRPPILGLSKVRGLVSTEHRDDLFRTISFDIPDGAEKAEDLRCVVIGKAKPDEHLYGPGSSCYVLIVRGSSDKMLRGVYQRAGAGILREDQIVWDLYGAGNLH
ncbi:hypothetical protein FZEAL_9110 [Fusarium zealandicum]|uniref:Protein kinase domain-containing protein n=1 Tax=Fusarium zealandicum TaxID=1053134 RepID=A0A8H4XH62_9HYPO|nr:hypothetical protein FZEAL_9110 [Fusarium zealandicum]